MSIGMARFYKMKGSLSSGEYPLFANDQDLTGYLVSSAEVKYAKGLQTRIEVPTFTGFDTVNIVEIDGMYYWVTAWHESTTYNGSVSMTLDFMGPTSLYKSGDTIKGNWHKTPTAHCKYMGQVISNDVMQESRYVALPKLPTIKLGGKDWPLFWYQVVGYDNNNAIKRYGGFMAYDEQRGLDQNTLLTSPNASATYPTYAVLLNDITTFTGILAENVLDFSISERCPYPYTITHASSSLDYVALNTGTVETHTAHGITWGMYDLTSVDYGKANWTVSLNLSEMERALGQVIVKDCNANNLMTIPASKSATIDLAVATFADMSGIYTMLSHGDQVISMREGQLPYLGNTWETYRAYQLDTDMMQLQYNFENNKYNLETARKVAEGNATVSAMQSAGQSMSMATISPTAGLGGLVGAGFGIGASLGKLEIDKYELGRNYDLQNRQAQQDFILSQKTAINQPQTSYNNGYGTIYCHDSVHNISKMSLIMPYNMNSTYFDNWVAQFGYPAEGVMDIDAEIGYYQGKLLSGDSDDSGMYWDETNKIFNQGFRFIYPGAPPLPPVMNAKLINYINSSSYGGVSYKTFGNLTFQGADYSLDVTDEWASMYANFARKSDKNDYVVLQWGQRTGEIDLDQFGYCRYYLVDDTLYGINSYYGWFDYSEITLNKDAILEYYEPTLTPTNEQLTEYVINNAFDNLTDDSE